MVDLPEEYDRIAPVCNSIRLDVQKDLEAFLSDSPFIDSVTGRVKRKQSFLTKANGSPTKYGKPFSQVEDLLAFRVLVYFERDASLVAAKIRDGFYLNVEDFHREPELPNQFGYEGYHLVQSLPQSYIDQGNAFRDFPRVIEIQVKTLFMHAAAEPEHLIKYKRPTNVAPLSRDDLRRLAWVAAAAWGSDQIYNDLREVLASQ